MLLYRAMRLKLKPLTLTNIFDIPIRISYGWFPVFALHVSVISAVYVPRHLPDFHPAAYGLLGLTTTLLLFLSIFGHELGHALAARAEGLRIYEITLHVFGGLTRFDREANTPWGDFKIALAGPAVSFFHGFFYLLVYGVCTSVLLWPTGGVLAIYLAITNLILGAFNLLPGFPLDGGRVLRAWLWHRSGDLAAATRWSIKAGRGIGYFLIALGVFWMTRPTPIDLLVGAWAIISGGLAVRSLGMFQQVPRLRPLQVADAMLDPISISPETTIEKLVDKVLPQHRQPSFPVSVERRFYGIVSLEQIRSIPRDQWSQLAARDVMVPVNTRLFVHPTTLLSEAHTLLSQNEVGYAGVIDESGYLVGFIGLRDIRKRLAS